MKGSRAVDHVAIELIRLALHPDDAHALASVTPRIASLTGPQWRKILEQLRAHRLMPLVYHALKAHGLDSKVPQLFRHELLEEHTRVLAKNSRDLCALDSLLTVMDEHGMRPVIWKGAVLIDQFYPDMGTRPMSDIDFGIPSDKTAEYINIFMMSGYDRKSDVQGPFPDAIEFINQAKVRCDVHHRFRLFEGKEHMLLTMQLKPRRMGISTYTVLEPNAMLVHLVTHMNGHQVQKGPVLLWVLDVAYVIREWGDRLDLERLKALMPAKQHLASLYRIVRFLENECAEKMPRFLSDAARGQDSWTFAEIFRQRRLAAWGIPGWRGWLRLGASGLGLKLKNRRPSIRAHDLFLLPRDIIINFINGINIYRSTHY